MTENTFPLKLFQHTAKAVGKAADAFGFVGDYYEIVTEAELASAQNKAVADITAYFGKGGGDLLLLQSGQADNAVFETLLIDIFPSGQTIVLTRYVGLGENVGDAMTIRASGERRFFSDDYIAKQARAVLPGAGQDATFVVRDRFATKVSYDFDQDVFAHDTERSIGPQIKEATLIAGVVNRPAGKPLASVEELATLKRMQAQYEDDVADNLMAQDVAKLKEMAAARDRISDNLAQAIKAYEEALEQAQFSSGMAILSALLSLAGQAVQLGQPAELDALFDKVEGLQGLVREQQASYTRMLQSMADYLAQHGFSAPGTYSWVGVQLPPPPQPPIVHKYKGAPILP